MLYNAGVGVGTKFGQDFEGELAALEQSLRQFESESGPDYLLPSEG